MVEGTRRTAAPLAWNSVSEKRPVPKRTAQKASRRALVENPTMK